MNLIQSFIFSSSHGSMSLYEQRIIICIVEKSQYLFRDRLIKDITRDSLDIPLRINMTLDSRVIMSNDSKHYEYVRQAALRLCRKVYTYWDSERDIWSATSIINDVVINRGLGQISFSVHRDVLAVISDFAKGFSLYDMDIALSLSSVYSIRLYMIVNNSHRPFTISLYEIRKLFGLEDKYKQNADLIKRVIEPAREELDSLNINGFSFDIVKHGQKITHLTIKPIKRQSPSLETLQAKVSLSFFVDREIYLILVNYIGFSFKELSCHKSLLKAFCELPACIDRMRNIESRYKRNGKGKGYVINAMKLEVEQFRRNNDIRLK